MPLQEINLFIFDQLAVESEAWTGLEGAYTVEVYSVVTLSDELQLKALVEANSVVTLDDELVIVLLFDDALAISDTVECEQSAYKASIVELLDSLDVWSELPVQESEVALTDELTFRIIAVYAESVVELTDNLELTTPARSSLKWYKTGPSTPAWTKVVVA